MVLLLNALGCQEGLDALHDEFFKGERKGREGSAKVR